MKDIESRLSMLHEAEDNYYVTAKYILELTKRAYDLFKCSEIDEKRQLLKLVLSNITLKDKKVQFEAQKPFDQIFIFADRQAWLPLIDRFRNDYHLFYNEFEYPQHEWLFAQ